MSTHRRLLVLVPTLVLLLGACGAREEAKERNRKAAALAAAAAGKPIEIRVTERVSGASTGLEIGHVLRVELEANETTGYRWRFVEGDPKILKPPDEQEYVPPADDAPPGAAGLSIWRFEAVGSGTTTLKLEYVRAFEEDAPPAKSFTLKVAVGE